MLLNMTAMAAKRELCYEFCAFNVVVSTGSRRFSTKHKVQSNTQSCVSSVSVTCMRRTCIVLMRIVVAKKKKQVALGGWVLALGLIVVWQVLSSMVPARHIYLFFGFCLTTMRLLRRFRQADCSSGGEWPLSPEGTARAAQHRVLLCLQPKGRRSEAIIAGPCVTSRLARQDSVYMFCGRWFCFPRWDGGGGCAWAPARGHRCWRSGWVLREWICQIGFLGLIHEVFAFFKSNFWLTLPVVRQAAAAGCAGIARTSWLQVLLVFTSFEDTRHEQVFSTVFFWRFLLLPISQLCCFSCIVSQEIRILFVRSDSLVYR